jgi:hydrogenase nickel incorporation protein HypA/HybF
MHEYSILSALLDRVEAEAQAHRASAVTRIHVRIGELAGVDPALLRSAYTLFRARTICQDADLEIDEVPARWTCPRCERPIARGDVLRCPACGTPARLTSGDEIVLDHIALEVP